MTPETLANEIAGIVERHEKLRRTNDGHMSGDFLATFAREDRLLSIIQHDIPGMLRTRAKELDNGVSINWGEFEHLPEPQPKERI